MMSKKDVLTLGILSIGGIGVASMIAGSSAGGAGGDLAAPTARAGGILGSAGRSGNVYNIPASGEVVFPETPKFDFSKFFITPETPVSRGAAGVSAAPKKFRDTGETAFGYAGYVTPKTPTPVLSGYTPGATKFVPYAEPVYVPSPVKPPSVSYAPKKQPISSGGSSRTGTRRTSVTGKYSGR